MGHPKAGRPKEGTPVKYFTAVLAPGGFSRWDSLLARLESVFGSIDYRGRAVPFDMTDYYENEMGTGIERTIVSFTPLGAAPDLPRIKHATTLIEEEFSGPGGRAVNVDPGYIDYFKAVLASFKEGPQKIYLGEGVYADPVLTFMDGKWDVFRWSFPDFKEGLYMEDFEAMRKLYKFDMRGTDRNSG